MRKRRRLGFILTTALVCSVGSAGAADFRVKPYVQNPAQNAMTVLWLSDSNTAGSLTVTGIGTFSSSPTQDGGKGIPAPSWRSLQTTSLQSRLRSGQ